MTLRGSRLWQDSLAHATIYEGDVGECSKWLGYAKQKLQFMLHNTAGPLTATFNPAADVTVRVDTRPNRIYIKSGVIDYITVMAPTGDSSGYSYANRLVPPWQPIQQRYFFKTPNEVQLASKALYGGNKRSITVSESGSNYPGGYWSNDKGLACSWTFNTLFIQGKYANLLTPIANGHYDAQIKRVILLSPYAGHITNAESGGLPVDLVAVVFHTYTDITPSVTSGTQIKRFDIVGLAGTSETFTAYLSPDATDAALLTPDTTQEKNIDVFSIFVSGVATNFTATTRSFFWLEESVGVDNRVTQVIKKRTFDATISSYTDTTIYSHVVVGYSYGATYSLLSGEPILCHMQTESDSVGLVRANITSVTGHRTKGSGSKDVASVITRSYQIALLLDDGTLSIVSDAFATTTIDTSAVGTAPLDSSSDVNYVTDDDTDELWLMAFSAKKNVVCYAIFNATWVDTYTSTASTNSKVTNKTWKFDLYLRYGTTTVNLHNKALVTENSTSTFSIPALQTIIRDFEVVSGSESLPPVTFEQHAKAVSRTMIMVCYNGETTITVLVELSKPAAYRTLNYRVDYSSTTTTYSPLAVVSAPFTLGTIASTTVT